MGGEHGLPPSLEPRPYKVVYSARCILGAHCVFSLPPSLSPFMHSTPAALLLLRRVSSVVFVRASSSSFFAESVGVMCRD